MACTHPLLTIIMYNKNSDVHNHNTGHRNYLHVSMAQTDLYAKVVIVQVF